MPEIKDQDVVAKDLKDGLFRFHDSFGYDSSKRSNLHLFPGTTENPGIVIMYSAGNLIIFKNLLTGVKQTIRSPAGSVGAMAVHRNGFSEEIKKKYFVIKYY